MIVAIDPGRDKCGLVAMNEIGEIKYQQVISSLNFQSTMLDIIDNFKVQIIILGNGTTSKDKEEKILEMISTKNLNITLKVVDEKYTTEEARKLYWKKNPPRGWRKLLPTSMQVPPVPVDDLVAEILAKRFLKNEE